MKNQRVFAGKREKRTAASIWWLAIVLGAILTAAIDRQGKVFFESLGVTTRLSTHSHSHNWPAIIRTNASTAVEGLSNEGQGHTLPYRLAAIQ